MSVGRLGPSLGLAAPVHHGTLPRTEARVEEAEFRAARQHWLALQQEERQRLQQQQQQQ